MTNPIPAGFTTVTPHLTVKGAADAIDLYTRAFNATELSRHTVEGTDRVMNAQLRIGNAVIMLNDEVPEYGCLGPASDQRPPVTLHLYVDDVDAIFDQAVAAGCTPTMPVADTFWGDRYGQLTDPFGHAWSVATRTEDLPADEVARRAQNACG